MANIALLIAGGSGSRMHQDIPKQFLTVNEKPVIVYTLEAFEHHPEIDAIAVVCIAGWEQVLWAYARQFNINKLQLVVPGGENGQGSIRNGVFALEERFAADDHFVAERHDLVRQVLVEKARLSHDVVDASGVELLETLAELLHRNREFVCRHALALRDELVEFHQSGLFGLGTHVC